MGFTNLMTTPTAAIRELTTIMHNYNCSIDHNSSVNAGLAYMMQEQYKLSCKQLGVPDEEANAMVEKSREIGEQWHDEDWYTSKKGKGHAGGSGRWSRKACVACCQSAALVANEALDDESGGEERRSLL
jgi:hypothetical protein